MVQALILTGCRRDEVRAAPRAETDLAKREWLLPAARVKNSADHLVPIGDALAAILRELPVIGGGRLLFTTTGDTPISGLSKVKARLHKAMAKDLEYEPAPWSLHDIRRTFVSGLQRLGVGLEVREACVNHRSITRAGVAGVYGRYDYWQEKQAAFALWEAHVRKVIAPPSDGNVVPLRAVA
jgi:integrase